MRSSSLVFPAVLLLAAAALPSCGWFAPADPTVEKSAPPAALENQDPAALLPKCRPADAVVQRGEVPFKVGEATASGWAISEVNTENVEYIRIAYTKDGNSTMVEIAFNEGTEGDWSTAAYRLMPAPGHEPPPDLLQEVMGTLKSWQTSQSGTPFVVKKAGVVDPYDGLPPCGADGLPM
jgi:hypothetical protein